MRSGKAFKTIIWSILAIDAGITTYFALIKTEIFIIMIYTRTIWSNKSIFIAFANHAIVGWINACRTLLITL